MQALTQPTRRKEAANRPEPDPSPVRYFRLVLIHKLAQAPSNTSLRRGHRGSLADRESLAIHRPRKGPDPSPARQRGPGDVGFGYIGNNADSSSMAPKSPLKSAMKVPGTPARNFSNPLSPTFREEDILEKRELSTDKEQARDLVSGSQKAYMHAQLSRSFCSFVLTRVHRKSKLESAWPSLRFEESTLAARSSSSP